MNRRLAATQGAKSTPDARAVNLEQSLHQIRDALRTLEYGEVSIVVQDGVVIQIERTERKRLTRRRD